MRKTGLLLLLPFLGFATASELTPKTLRNLIESLKGSDVRLFRWDVTDQTKSQQEKGDCQQMKSAADLLMDSSASPELQELAADYCTLCITNNPQNRAQFSNVDGIHKAVISLLDSSDPKLSYLAAHVIYISTYTNEKNHYTYYSEGAVPALSKVIMNEETKPVQRMWALAALANLAASYCSTTDDGTCWWEWTATNEHIQLEEESLLQSDGSPVRKAMLQVDGLVDTLIDLACHDPLVEEDEESGVAMPGISAVAGDHDEHQEIVTWAAMSCLKNLSLEPTAKPLLEHRAMFCACYLKESADWLENSKSFQFLHHMRREEDPCLFREDGKGLCINDNFLDAGFYHCDDYEEAEEEECDNPDIFTGAKASDACCYCEGGESFLEEGGEEEPAEGSGEPEEGGEEEGTEEEGSDEL